MNEGDRITSQFLSEWHRGDGQALNNLLVKHLPWIEKQVRKRIGRVLRSKGDTSDYVQDSMLQFLKYGPRFIISDENHFRALLLRIVENAVRDKYDWFKARRRDISREAPLPSETVLVLDANEKKNNTPSQYADANEQEALVRLGMEFLDPDDQKILILHQWDDLSFVEIGKQLSITSNAARKRHNRAVKRLSHVVWALHTGNLDQIL